MGAALDRLRALCDAHPVRRATMAASESRRWPRQRVNIEKNQRRQLKRAIGARQLRKLEREARRGG